MEEYKSNILFLQKSEADMAKQFVNSTRAFMLFCMLGIFVIKKNFNGHIWYNNKIITLIIHTTKTY